MNNIPEQHTSALVFWSKLGYGALTIGLMATYGWPLIILMGAAYYGIGVVVKIPTIQAWGTKVLDTHNLPKLLPAPKQQQSIQKAPVKNELRVIDPYEHLSFWDRVTKPYDSSVALSTHPIELNKQRGVNEEDRQVATLYKALKRLPGYFNYRELSAPPTRLSVPIGLDANTQQVLWGDFDSVSDQSRILHALVAGQTNSGKDSILRLWFTTLTMNNTPEEIKFIILDGKIDWLSDALARSAYMAIPPAGGMEIKKIDGKRVDLAHERMLESMDWVFEEIERRSELLRATGTIDLTGYNAKALRNGEKPLPMLFLIASDVGKAFNDELGMLVQQLIMKGRSYGVRMIISMQDPVGENTGWRAQIGLVMSAYQQDPLHDSRIMGVNVKRLLVRPSQLPNPDEDDIAKGLFVVRQGSKQYIVRTPHLPEDDWFSYIEDKRFVKRWYSKEEQSQMLYDLLGGKSGVTRRLEPIKPAIIKKPTDLLTHAQIKRIASLSTMGYTKTQIMEDLGFMNSAIWSKYVTAVEQVILATRGSLKR